MMYLRPQVRAALAADAASIFAAAPRTVEGRTGAPDLIAAPAISRSRPDGRSRDGTAPTKGEDKPTASRTYGLPRCLAWRHRSCRCRQPQDGAISMKTVLSGVALAAILALASPAWAQTPSAQPSQPEPTNASMPPANNAQATPGTTAGKMSQKNKTHAAMHHSAKSHHAAHARSMHRTTAARAGGNGPTDNVANQLNREEAQKLTGSSTPPIGNPNTGPMGAPNQPPPIQGQ